MLDDLRRAARGLGRVPGFAVATVLILGLGIGAAGAMFVTVDAYYLRGLPGVADPGRLVNVGTTLGGRPGGDLTFLDFADLRADRHAFSGVAAYRPTVLDVGRGADTRRIPAAIVSSNYFAVLGAGVERGRVFLPEEERPAHAHPLAVISDRLWRAGFAGDSGIVGRDVFLNGRRFTIVGVAARGFRGHLPAEAYDVWVPLAMCVEASPEGLVSLDNRTWRWLRVIARLAPGTSLEAAGAATDLLAQRLQAAGAGAGERFGLSLERARRPLARDGYALLLIAGVAVLFLAVCANLSSLFLARASARRREMATRLALGATPAGVLRPQLAEGLVLGLLGGVVGFAAAGPVATGLLAWSGASAGETPAVDLGASGHLALFVLAVSVASGVLLGLGPALQVSRLEVAAGLREGVGGRTAGRSPLRGALVVVQLAVSLVLLSGGGLLFKTLRNYGSLVAVPEPGQILLLSVQPSHQGYDADRARAYFRQLLERMQRLPGVRSAALARDVTFADASFFQETVAAEQSALAPGTASVTASYAVVAPDYFRTMGASLVRGRDFTAADRSGAPPVAIVNATLARTLWPGVEPLGRLLWIGGEGAGREVVGVAPDRPTSDGPQAFVYYPLYQAYPWPGSRHALYLRVVGRPLALLAAVRREAAALDAGVPLFDPRTFARANDTQRSLERLAGAVLGGAGLLALLLAAVGLYGLTSQWVALRTQEIGVRMALGAGTGRVLAVVVGRALRLAVAGVALGLAAAVAANRVWSSFLFGARAADPDVLGAAAALLVAVALLASYLPARRAAGVDPAAALRAE